MVVACFYRGPFDGKRLVLPCDQEDPWEHFVLPRWDDPLFLEVYYLRAGRLEEAMWAYLLDDGYAVILEGA